MSIAHDAGPARLVRGDGPASPCGCAPSRSHGEESRHGRDGRAARWRVLGDPGVSAARTRKTSAEEDQRDRRPQAAHAEQAREQEGAGATAAAKKIDELERRLQDRRASTSRTSARAWSQARALERLPTPRRGARGASAASRSCDEARGARQARPRRHASATTVVVELPGDALFDAGRETLVATGGAPAQGGRGHPRRPGPPPRTFQVAGHTDTPRPGGRFKDSWGLSVMRAREVLGLLVRPAEKGGGGINPTRWSAAGYGDTDPLKSDDTPEGKQRESALRDRRSCRARGEPRSQGAHPVAVGCASPRSTSARTPCSARRRAARRQARARRRARRDHAPRQGVDETRALEPEAVGRTLACLATVRGADRASRGSRRRRGHERDARREGRRGFRGAPRRSSASSRASSRETKRPRSRSRARSPGSTSRAVDVFDVGGGSTEINRRAAAGDSLDRAVSLDVGSVRLTERHVSARSPTATRSRPSARRSRGARCAAFTAGAPGRRRRGHGHDAGGACARRGPLRRRPRPRRAPRGGGDPFDSAPSSRA